MKTLKDITRRDVMKTLKDMRDVMKTLKDITDEMR